MPRDGRPHLPAWTATVIAALALAAPAGAAVPVPAAGITQGVKAGPAAWPQLAHVHARTPAGTVHCGGTVIAARTVLTAAHCTLDPAGHAVPPGAYRVITGRSRLSASGTGQEHGVAEVVRHPGHVLAARRADLALLRLDGPTSAPPMRLARDAEAASYRSPAGVPNTAGWGSLTPGGGEVDALSQAYLELRAAKECAGLAPGVFDPATQLCAGTAGAGTCQGDSGGPLVVFAQGEPVLLGVTSFGPVDCGSAPSFFTRVSAYEGFLTDTTTAGAAGPPATGSAIPAPGPRPGPVARDRRAPRLTRLRTPAVVRLRGIRPAAGIVVRVRSDEPAIVEVRLLRRGRPLAGTRTALLRAGENRFVIPRRTWRLRAGRLRLQLRATDAAGNVRTAGVAIRARR